MITVMYGYEIVNGMVWIEVVDPDGRLGWVPQTYTSVVTLTPAASPTATETLSPANLAAGTASPVP